MLTAVLFSGVEIGVELYKAYMRNYYAETGAVSYAKTILPD